MLSKSILLTRCRGKTQSGLTNLLQEKNVSPEEKERFPCFIFLFSQVREISFNTQTYTKFKIEIHKISFQRFKYNFKKNRFLLKSTLLNYFL